MNRLFEASVADNRQIINNHFLLTLRPSEKTIEPKPGQFFMLSVDNDHDPLLKRPFSIHRWSDGTISFLYRVVGRGTDILSRKKKGETLEILGPLGNGFPLNRSCKKIIIIAGGIGIAPIYALASTLTARKHPPPILFYGARTEMEILFIDEIKSMGIETVISTDDGTAGKKGNIVNVLKKFFKQNSSLITHHTIYACGPVPMLKSLSAFAVKHGIKGYAALEEKMACGLGACLGCTVNTAAGYKRVCKEGPVFPLEEIVWK